MEISLQPWNSFKPDGVILFSDILTPLPGIGVNFDIDDNKGPIIDTPIRTLEQVKQLHAMDFSKVDFVGRYVYGCGQPTAEPRAGACVRLEAFIWQAAPCPQQNLRHHVNLSARDRPFGTQMQSVWCSGNRQNQLSALRLAPRTPSACPRHLTCRLPLPIYLTCVLPRLSACLPACCPPIPQRSDSAALRGEQPGGGAGLRGLALDAGHLPD